MSKADEEFVVKMRRDIHQHPEISGQEERTAARVIKELNSMKISDIRSGIAGHGIIAVIGKKKEGQLTVALRADMDALPIQEQTNLPFASVNEGVMHACGHDSHIAMLLGAARLLKSVEGELNGQVVLIFQPAEENAPVGGSRPMIEAGALDSPKPDAVFGLHVWPTLPVGQVGVRSGFLMGASDRFKLTIKGKGGHASMPHETVDSIIVAMQVIQALQTIVSRNVNPMDAGVITIGKLEAGTRYNVIADEAVLEGTVRLQRPEVRSLLKQRVEQVAELVAKSLGARAQLEYSEGYPVLVNSEEETEMVRLATSRWLGKDALATIEPALTAEDFAVYLQKFPGSFCWLGCGFPDESKNFPLHHPQFQVDERVLPIGAQLLAEIALTYIQEKSR